MTRPVRPVGLRHCQFWLPTLLQPVCLFFLIIMVTKKFLAAVQHGCDWFADPLPTHIIRKYYAEPWLEILNTLYLRMLCFGEFLPLNLSCICGLKCWILVWLLMIGMLDCPSRSMGTLRGTLHSAAVRFSSGYGGTPPHPRQPERTRPLPGGPRISNGASVSPAACASMIPALVRQTS